MNPKLLNPSGNKVIAEKVSFDKIMILFLIV